MEQGQRRQALLLGVALLLMSLVVGCGNTDAETEVRGPQGTEPRTLAASESAAATQVTLRLTGLS